ncbi:MAG TPA: TadE family protein [Thermomicrobiales bacterium]
MRVLRGHWRLSGLGERGQATVEFAIVSVFLLLTVFGTIDFGRAIYLKSELETAVREAAREARVRTASSVTCGGTLMSQLEFRVRHMKNLEYGEKCNEGEHPRPGLENATVSYSCTPSCTSGGKLTVTASLPFQAVTQEFLGLRPLTLTATATVTLE